MRSIERDYISVHLQLPEQWPSEGIQMRLTAFHMRFRLLHTLIRARVKSCRHNLAIQPDMLTVYLVSSGACIHRASGFRPAADVRSLHPSSIERSTTHFYPSFPAVPVEGDRWKYFVRLDLAWGKTIMEKYCLTSSATPVEAAQRGTLL